MSSPDKVELHILGTGGGRFVMTSQMRRTAGLRLVSGGTQVHVDPGPGALVFSNWAKLSPSKLDALVVTHCHPDHYGDAEVFIEAMTRGTRSRRGVLAAPKGVLYGCEGIGPCISEYHRGLPGEVVELEPGVEFNVNGLNVEALEARHSDPSGVGLKFKTPVGDIVYTGDTGYFPELADQYTGSRLLVACVIWPRDNRLNMHLNTDDLLKVIQASEPGAVVMTHFGSRMLKSGPEKEAEYLEAETGVPIVAAQDGMVIELSGGVVVRGPRKSDEPRLLDV